VLCFIYTVSMCHLLVKYFYTIHTSTLAITLDQPLSLVTLLGNIPVPSRQSPSFYLVRLTIHDICELRIVASKSADREYRTQIYSGQWSMGPNGARNEGTRTRKPLYKYLPTEAAERHLQPETKPRRKVLPTHWSRSQNLCCLLCPRSYHCPYQCCFQSHCFQSHYLPN
jgi:hypothetical protein